jgi:hypothetical protein
MQLHVFDTSSFNLLVEPEAALARHRLLEEVDAEHVLFLLTHPLIWETLGTRAVDDAKYRAMTDLAARISKRRLLIDPPTRRVRELEARRALTLAEVIDPEHEFVGLLDPEKVDREAAMRSGMGRGLRFAEAEKANAAALDLDDLARAKSAEQGEAPPTSPSKIWRRGLKQGASDEYLLALAEHFAGSAVERFGDHYRIDVTGVEPRRLPSFWASALIHVARVQAVMVARHSPTGRKTANRCEVLSFEQWAERLTR